MMASASAGETHCRSGAFISSRKSALFRRISTPSVVMVDRGIALGFCDQGLLAETVAYAELGELDAPRGSRGSRGSRRTLPLTMT